MQRNFNDLPGEILDIIFDYVREFSEMYGVKQCQLVCKNWMSPAQRCLYSEIVICDVEAVNSLMENFGDRKCSSPGRLTRALAYKGICNNTNEMALCINAFIEIFPNVRHIYCQNEDIEYFSALIKAHGEGKWKDMESIGVCPEYCKDIHNACALLHQNTLQILNVRDGDHDDPTSSLYDQLHFFPNIKELFLETRKRNFIQYSELATKNMPNLKVVGYENTIDENYRVIAAHKPVDLSLITPQYNVKELVIEGICYENDNFLLYLMTKYPALKSIKINQKKEIIERQPELFKRIKLAQNNFSLPVLSKFLVFVGKCKSHTVDYLYTAINVDELLNSYYKSCDSQESKIIGFTYAEGSNWQDPEEQRASNDLLVHIDLEADNVLHKNAVMFNYKPVGANLPHIKVLENSGKEIDHLVICIGIEKTNAILRGQDEEMIGLANGLFFSHFIEHCPSLRRVHVYFSRILKLNSSQYTATNTFVTDMSLERVVISQGIMTEISKRLPSLKRLILKDIHYFDEDDENAVTNFNTEINMLHTSFRFLYVQNHVLDGACYYHYPSKILIKLSTEIGNNYYKHEAAHTSFGDSAFGVDSDDEEFSADEEHIDLKISHAIHVNEEDYNDGLDSHDFANIHITCKSLNYLVVSLKKISPALSCFVLLTEKADDALTSMDKEEMCAHFMKENC